MGDEKYQMFHIFWIEISIIAILCIIFYIDFNSLLHLVRNPKYLCGKILRIFLNVFIGNINYSKKRKREKQSDKTLYIDDDLEKNNI